MCPGNQRHLSLRQTIVIGPMRILFPVLAATFAACLGATAAAQSAFAGLTGVFGKDFSAESCAVNPKAQSFSPDHRRIRMVWAMPVDSYMTDERITVVEGDIVAQNDRSVTYRRDGETRLDADGRVILWTLRLNGDGESFCISSTKSPGDSCISTYRRCAGPVS